MMRLSGLLTFASLLLAAGLFGQALETSADPTKKVLAYVETLLHGEVADLEVYHDQQMKTAMTPESVAGLKKQLSDQFGSVQTLGDAWRESDAQGHERYRVPVVFERRTMDLRIAVNKDQKIAGLFLAAHSEPPPELEESAPGTETEVEVGEASPLPGTLLIPAGEGPFPAVVFVHGSGANDRNETIGPNRPFLDLAYGLGKAGIASLRYDKRSQHDPKELMKLGDAMTVEHEVIADARLAVQLLASHSEIDLREIYVVGHSLGGTVAPRIPNEETPVAGLVLLAATTRGLPELVVEQSRYIASLSPDITEQQRNQLTQLEETMSKVRKALNGEITPPKGFLMGAPVGYYRDLEAYPPVELLASAKKPVMVLQGMRDYQVTLADFAAFEGALEGKNFACLKTYPSLDHLFMEGEGPSTPSDYQTARRVATFVFEDIAAWILDKTCEESVQ